MPTLLTRCRAAWSAFRVGESAADPASPPAVSVAIAESDIPRYPPFLQGLPVASTAQILATQSELIASLQEALAMTDSDYQTLVLPLIERYAAFAHLLPASETHHHRGAGGLFRHGLEVAFQCARASRGRLFAVDRMPEERRLLEPRWQLAAAVVGLLHDVGKPVADLLVLDREGTTRWQPVDETILDWATQHGIDRYFLRWNGQRLHQGHEVFTTSVFPQFITRELRRWLMDPDPLVWYSLGSVLAGRDDQALLAQLMREADRISVEQDLRENRLDPEALSLGVPIERYLIDTMRALLRDGTWAVNSPGARVWVFPAGLHLVWPESAQDLVQRLAEARVPGIPRDPDTLADLLLERQLAIPCPLEGSERPARTWQLAPQALTRDQPQWLSFLRLAEPELLFSGVLPRATALIEESTASAPAPRSVPTELVTEEAQARAVGSPLEADDTEAMPKALQPLKATSSADTEAVPAAAPWGSSRPSNRAAPSESPEPSLAESARAWLDQHPPAGPGLIALMRRVEEGRQPAEGQPRWIDGQCFLPYPHAFLGSEDDPDPERILDDLWMRDWITRDPRRPLVRVRALDGVSGVLLTSAISERLLALGNPASSVSAESCRPAPERDAPPPPKSMSSTTKKPRSRQATPARSRTGAAEYALALEQRLLARDPTLGPIQVHENALSVALHGPVLDGAKAAGIAEATLLRALRKRPRGQVEQGRFSLGL
ncbi:relaxase [Thiorhodococcus mannitoliphagus]|uniref:Relaxase n=2 Tax=Thiorhodococcus mannitoliphagus TaxID=329406 RepID=A0A6P1DTM0_9GAMM|nr:MobH family relaxase [Thiorhodococcus mannitoliphagus]NEX20291.1 relaxase [Thiorhodococcus mannitoliphagus]